MDAKKLFTIYLGLDQNERIKFQHMVQRQNHYDRDELLNQKKEIIEALSRENPFIKEWLEHNILNIKKKDNET